ncbi:hypothetical protein NE236_15650 [Actinoallomurus purpureus]|uniref:hypothetical protein n=1 Tax=Actinoallomurus purpureus TaxID=478114 RepID=UPI002092C6A8|nr:hypothetical protein [Actinoallomurus purpureus]MCO6006419.1 hypothetical protein [Actinoallomurus purpureus]
MTRLIVRAAAWVCALVLGASVIFFGRAWFAWQREPSAYGTSTNALWARHQWVGEAHAEGEYRALADTLRRNRISDVFFHVGPLTGDGEIPPSRYAHAGELLAALRRLAPEVRAQAYVGQVERSGGGPLDLRAAATRENVLTTDRALLDLGFAGIHYDIEPIYPDDRNFLDLLTNTHRLTRARGRVLSAALEQQTLADWTQPLFRAVLPRGKDHYPPRPTAAYLRAVADRVDQVAIMTYDSEAPTRALAGRHFAHHTERTLSLIGDRVTVFMGVPTYRSPTPWAEDLPTALRGVRQGVAELRHRPRRPYGVAVYADWTTNHREWAAYRAGWPAEPH